MTTPQDAPRPTPPGTVLGDYRVEGLLGAGAVGAVFRARHLPSGREVAVKDVGTDADRRAALSREAALLADARHPNVVGVHEVVTGSVDGLDRCWLVQDLVAGPSLAAVLDQHGPLTAEQALAVLHGGLTGLAHVHALGMVHGDVSPQNVLVDLDGTVKLVDFGSAGGSGATGTGVPVAGGGGPLGTPAFASPEAVRGGPLTPRSDVYSAAAVLHLLLSGTPLYPRRDAAAVLLAQVGEAPPRWDGDGPHVADLLQRALAKDPADRPADAAVLLRELEEAATRTHGAGWLARAGLAGLAGSAGAGTAVLTGSAGAAGGGGSAVGSSVLAAGAAAARAGRPVWSTGRRVLAGAVTAAVAAAVVVLVVVASGDTEVSTAAQEEPESTAAAESAASSSAAASSSSAAASASASAAAAQAGLEAVLPDGVYEVTTTVFESSNANWPVGDTRVLPWTVTSTCDAVSCTTSIVVSEFVTYSGVFDGTRLSTSGPGITFCTEESGAPIPGTESVTDVVTIELTPDTSTPGGPPSFSGTGLRTVTAAPGPQTAGCNFDSGPGTTNRADYRLTYTGPAAAAPPAEATPTG